MLLIQAALLTTAAIAHSPTYDETAHLAAGVSKWRHGRFDLYRVNPPLAELAAVLPVLAAGYEADWRSVSERVGVRSDFELGRDFAGANGRHSLRLVTLARLALISLVLIGGWICWLWGRALFGPRAGLTAAALWTFSPTVLGNGALVTADAAAGSAGLAAGYLFWWWLRDPGWGRAAAVGAGLGLALLTKFTWLLVVPLWPALWLAYRLSGSRAMAGRDWGRQAGQLAAAFLLALYLINAGYGFERSFRPLGTMTFESGALTGKPNPGPLELKFLEDRLGNRLRGTALGSLPVPVPANYLAGIDVQKADFEWIDDVYLLGEKYPGGTWYWYCYALLVKEPVGLWLLLTASFVFAPLPKARELAVLLAPAASVLALVSWNHTLCHYRYALPALPFLFVAAGGAAAAVSWRRPAASAVVIGSLAWYAGSSLAVAPHWLSYFNEPAGGPESGWRHLSDSALDWGQGLVDLRWWLDRHPEAKPLRLAYIGNFDPRLAGIEFELPPAEPRPGWHAVSAVFLADGRKAVGADGKPRVVSPGAYAYFRHLGPVYRAADVLYVYHVTPEEAERVRRLLRNERHHRQGEVFSPR